MAKDKLDVIDAERIYDMALERYGLRIQFIKAVEELAELQKQICKILLLDDDLNKYPEDLTSLSCDGMMIKEHIVEEVADVEIMLDQIKSSFTNEIGEEYRRAKYEKLKRFFQRMMDQTV